MADFHSGAMIMIAETPVVPMNYPTKSTPLRVPGAKIYYEVQGGRAHAAG